MSSNRSPMLSDVPATTYVAARRPFAAFRSPRFVLSTVAESAHEGEAQVRQQMNAMSRR